MRKFILLIGVLAVLAGGAAGYKAFKAQLKTNLALNSAVANVTDAVSGFASRVSSPFRNACTALRSAAKSVSRLKDIRLPQVPEKAVFLRMILKHGGAVEGRLLRKTKGEYTIEWKGKEAVIRQAQIARVEEVTARETEWPHKNDVVVKKRDGIVLDGEITDANEAGVEVVFREGGGELQMHVPREEIDHILFAPVCDKESADIEKQLKSQFPKMKMYKDGNVTIFTDSYATSVKNYRKAIREHYTQIYLEFFKLFKGRRPQAQNFVVIFDNFQDYIVSAATDGVPGWLAIGYFSPLGKALYSFNAFGEEMEKMVFDVIVGKTGRFNDALVEPVKRQVDKRYHIFIDALAKKYTDKYWDVYNLYKNELTGLSATVLRHELAHEIFHNWGLQSIVLTKPNMDRKALSEKKREIMEEKDWKKKEELLKRLMRIKAREMEAMKPEEIMDASTAQSWLNEGMATYCETDPVGSLDEERLFSYQDAARKHELNPIEFLTNFKMGSFPGISHKGVLVAYGQSWAFTAFLMNRYPRQFMEYQIALAERATAKAAKGKAADELEILLRYLDTDLATLEAQFKEYMASYPAMEDPDVKRFMRYYKIWEDLLASG